MMKTFSNRVGFFIISTFCMVGLNAQLFAESQQSNVQDSSVKVKWGYKGNIGPERWGQLDPSFHLCDAGKLQSPINIKNKVKEGSNKLNFHYLSAPLVIIVNGKTDLTIGHTRTMIHDGHGVQINFSHLAKERITWNTKNYHLLQLHFHSPSENQWNGRSYPLEIHFVHQGEKGTLLVIGVFVTGGKMNPTLEKIIKHLPQEEGKEIRIEKETIQPINLIPKKLNFYHFQGSLTTPPCFEGVDWVLMADPITASPSQIVSLRKASGSGNARPIQNSHNREITFTSAK